MSDVALSVREREAITDAVHYAVELQNRGYLDQAEGLYRGVLKLAPNHVEALHFLGVLKNQQGQIQEALDFISTALALNSSWVQLIVNYAMVLVAARRYDEALETAERALALDPDHGDAQFQRGNALMGLNRPAEALECFERTLELQSGHVDAMVNCGNALLKLDRPANALAILERALAASPDHAGILNNYGQALTAVGRPSEALGYFDRAIANDALYAHAMINRADALFRLERFEEAIDACDDALALTPRHITALNIRGLALDALNHHEEAIETFDTIVGIEPDWAQVFNNRGTAQAALNRYAAAQASFRIATEVDPDFALAHTNDALASLLTGDFAEGFRKYEWRAQPPRDLVAPRWRGEESLAGKTLLLYHEQGFGDTLHCIRYARLAAARGARVIVEAPTRLAELLSGVEGVADVVRRGEPLPPHDLCCPMLRLPGAFATTPATIPSDVPYIFAPPERVAQWMHRLPATGRRRAGIVWAGNPRHLKDRNRSIPFERLAPLFAADRVDWISLQTNITATDRAALEGMRLRHIGDSLRDFADTAAVISMLDLVITVDTATAHLAGAMAKPVWIMLPFSPDWRWMLGRRDSPWYPTARLFRQAKLGDWDGVIAEVTSELDAG